MDAGDDRALAEAGVEVDDVHAPRAGPGVGAGLVSEAPLVALPLSLGTSITSGLSGVVIGAPPSFGR